MQASRPCGLNHTHSELPCAVEQYGIEQVPSDCPSKTVRSDTARRHVGDDGSGTSHPSDTSYLGTGHVAHALSDTEFVEKAQARGSQTFATDLLARERGLLDYRDAPAGARKANGDGRTSGACTDHEHVRVAAAHRANDSVAIKRRAAKQCVNGQAKYSSTRHAGRCDGHSEESSWPLKPAATLITAS